MSMINEQVRRMRTMADIIQHNGIKLLLTEAADTIEALSVKLAETNMERSDRYYGGGWIACSERLPEIGNKTYLVTYRTMTGKLHVRDCFYGSFIGSWSKKIGGEVIAWCELPEPYRS